MMMKSEQKKIIEFFRAEDGFTILPHINPDGDAFGSGSALFLVLKALRKRVQFVAVSYTHLDVYKRQPLARLKKSAVLMKTFYTKQFMRR